MLFEGANPSLIPKYCQVETDYKVRHSPTNNLCIAPLIFEHRKFSGNSFNFGNFRFQKCTMGYIWSLYVHYVYLLIY